MVKRPSCARFYERRKIMRIQILGGGCPKCEQLAQNAKTAIEELGIDAQVEKVTDFDVIMEMGAAVTPALAIDGLVKSAGKVASVEKIKEFLGH
jgi:small redox-active disulfide protein 2